MRLINQKLTCVLFAGLTFALVGCTGTRDRQSAGEYIDSRSMNVRVKAALLEDPEVRGTDINVNVWRSVVQLNGFVNNDLQRGKAEEIAWGVAGVRSVQNNLIVKDEVTPEALVSDGQPAAVGRPGAEASIGVGEGRTPAPAARQEEARGAGVQAEARVNLGQLAQSPREFYGRQAVVVGQVIQVLGPNAFTVAAPQRDQPALLVIGAGGAVPTVNPGDRVEARGLIGEFNERAIEQEFNITLDDRVGQDWQQGPSMVARQIRVMQPQQR